MLPTPQMGGPPMMPMMGGMGPPPGMMGGPGRITSTLISVIYIFVTCLNRCILQFSNIVEETYHYLKLNTII